MTSGSSDSFAALVDAGECGDSHCLVFTSAVLLAYLRVSPKEVLEAWRYLVESHCTKIFDSCSSASLCASQWLAATKEPPAEKKRMITHKKGSGEPVVVNDIVRCVVCLPLHIS